MGVDTEVFALPYATSHARVRAGLGALLGALVLALGVVPAAQAACPTAPTVKAFAGFGDNADYSLIPGGAFESGTTGWSLSGAAVATGNESYKVHGGADTKSLAVTPAGKAVSAAFCADIAHPTFRLFARRTGGSWGVLYVKVRWTNPSGAVNETVVGAISASDTAWHPSAIYNLAQVMGIWNGDQAIQTQLVFDPDDAGGSWAIDDVYVDPYARG